MNLQEEEWGPWIVNTLENRRRDFIPGVIIFAQLDNNIHFSLPKNTTYILETGPGWVLAKVPPKSFKPAGKRENIWIGGSTVANVVKYRLKKPKALSLLKDIAAKPTKRITNDLQLIS